MSDTTSTEKKNYELMVRFPPDFRDRLRMASLVREASINEIIVVAVGTFIGGMEAGPSYRQRLAEILDATGHALKEPDR